MRDTVGNRQWVSRSNFVQICGRILILRDQRSGALQRTARGAAANRRRLVLNQLTLTDLAILVGGFIVLRLLTRDSSTGSNVLLFIIFLAGFVGWKLADFSL